MTPDAPPLPRIARAEPPDIDALVALHGAALREELAASPARALRRPDAEAAGAVRAFFADAVASPSFAVFVAAEGMLPLGYLVACEEAALAERPPAIGAIHGLYVLPERRGAGLADRLLAEALAWFASRSLPLIELRVSVGSDRAMGFWRRHGFAPLETVLFRATGAVP